MIDLKEALNVALMMPKQEIKLEIGEKNVMSVMIPETIATQS